MNENLSKIEVECPEHHKYNVTWSDFKQGYRCPLCTESSGEKQLREILTQLYPNNQIVQYDKPLFLGGLELDFHIPELKMGFEYDGEQHFRPVSFGKRDWGAVLKEFSNIQKRDKRKNKLCQKQGYQLIRIRYDENLTTELVINKIGIERF